MKWTHYTICNYQQPVLFWSIIILTVFLFYYFFKQTTRTQEPSPHYCSSTGQNSKLFSHPFIHLLLIVHTREMWVASESRRKKGFQFHWERQERSDGGGTAWRVFFTRHEEGKGSPYYDDSSILFLLNMPQSKQLSMMYEYDPSNPIIIVVFLLSLCNLNPPLNSSAPPPLLMIYRASWL